MEMIGKSSGSSTPVQSAGSSGTSSIVFTSPFEDTSGLDVFAQIAASAHPLPVRRSITTSVVPVPVPTAINTPTLTPLPAPSAINTIVQQSQSQLAQSIYQSQQALRLQSQQQKRDSIDSTICKFDPKIDEDLDEGFFSDEDEDMEFDSDSEQGSADLKYKYSNNNNNNSKSSLLFDTPIKEETESDLMMDVDQSINFNQRRRSPSLSVESNDLNNNSSSSSNSNSNTQMFARRLSAPENGTGGFSTRRVIHNICERKRRENIRDGFEQLQNRLPNHLANNPKLSKMEILAGARNLINDIRGRISNLTAEISALSLVSDQIEMKETQIGKA